MIVDATIIAAPKVRYRGPAGHLTRASTHFALANLYLVRRQLLPAQARGVL